MNLLDIMLLAVITAIAFQFWRLRAMSEHARIYLAEYCEQHQLQLISLARSSTRIGSAQGKLDWLCEYQFEFSGNGEDTAIGNLQMAGKRVLAVNLPVYKVN